LLLLSSTSLMLVGMWAYLVAATVTVLLLAAVLVPALRAMLSAARPAVVKPVAMFGSVFVQACIPAPPSTCGIGYLRAPVPPTSVSSSLVGGVLKPKWFIECPRPGYNKIQVGFPRDKGLMRLLGKKPGRAFGTGETL
jgi:hypothetical protein